MRLSTKGRYAVMAMADLARNGADRAVSLAEIATRQEISLSYLEQLFARLRKSGLVKSVRGPGGGYRLARCVGAGSPKGCMIKGERCITHHLWEDLGQEIHRYLASVSLEDVIQNRTGQARMGAAPAAAGMEAAA